MTPLHIAIETVKKHINHEIIISPGTDCFVLEYYEYLSIEPATNHAWHTMVSKDGHEIHGSFAFLCYVLGRCNFQVDLSQDFFRSANDSPSGPWNHKWTAIL